MESSEPLMSEKNTKRNMRSMTNMTLESSSSHIHRPGSGTIRASDSDQGIVPGLVEYCSADEF